jgi:hypothetical protein
LAPAEALDVLGEYLKDRNIKIFFVGGKQAGDGRQLAVDALQVVGPIRVARRMDLVKQLRALHADPKTLPNLREALKDFMPELEKELKAKK